MVSPDIVFDTTIPNYSEIPIINSQETAVLKSSAKTLIEQGDLIKNTAMRVSVAEISEDTTIAVIGQYQKNMPHLIGIRTLSPDHMVDVTVTDPDSPDEKIYGFIQDNTDRIFTKISSTWGMLAFPFYPVSSPDKGQYIEALNYIREILERAEYDQESTEKQITMFQTFLNSS
ncbi:MAG TPA: hypothetical protein VLF89_05075 [Candidatus Saccharimonadales bacterium]|nr:hypothetical protein [Candidatus Saccharimonadales bacterium]HSW97170.1 hypothetical protein [Candidatus Saccharimonadales bacterium]